MDKPKCPKALKIILVGEGGQGIQTIAKIVTRVAFETGYHTTYIPNFGTEQRGGLSISYVQISCDQIVSPKFNTADIFIITTDRDIDRSAKYVGKNTHILYDTMLVNPTTVNILSEKTKNIAPVDAFKISVEKFTERSFNIILLGVITAIVDKDMNEKSLEIMDEKFKKYYDKNKDLEKSNESAFKIGMEMTQL